MRVLLFLLLFLSLEAWSCSSFPQEQYSPVDELIARTNDIVLAIVTKAEIGKNDWHVNYSFRVERWLKGKLPKNFTIIGSPTNEGSMKSFNHHRDERFWDDFGGRERGGTNCEISPGFGVGQVYLVFYNPPYHQKGFELIFLTHEGHWGKDRWLQYVENKIAP